MTPCFTSFDLEKLVEFENTPFAAKVALGEVSLERSILRAFYLAAFSKDGLIGVSEIELTFLRIHLYLQVQGDRRKQYLPHLQRDVPDYFRMRCRSPYDGRVYQD